MKTVRIHEFGDESVLKYEDAPVPVPAGDEVLVKIDAIGVNRADATIRRGAYTFNPDSFPVTMGMEFAGTVAARGDGVSEFTIGQRVVSYAGTGGYAEYAVAKALRTRPIPAGIDSRTAASVPVTFLTAWCGLVEVAAMKAGDWVLVQAGGSGVGVAAIQVCKQIGARVVVTAGNDEKCDRCIGLGADFAINYNSRDFVPEVMGLTGGRGADVVLEMVGGDVFTRSLEVVAPGGRFVSIGRAGGPVPDKAPELPGGRFTTRFFVNTYLNERPEGYRHIETFLKLIGEGRYQVIIDTIFPLSEAAGAHRRLVGREHFGKILLVP
ncbi:MAG: zinc-binding dehydrogenase [Chloroflexota bacterium]